VATVRFASPSAFNATVEALREACEQHRDPQGRLDLDHVLLLTAVVTARQRRTPGSGVSIDLPDEHVRLARRTLGDHPRAAVFDR
jgi:hypothetical protein